MAGNSIDDGSRYSWPVGSSMNRPEIEITFDKEYWALVRFRTP